MRPEIKVGDRVRFRTDGEIGRYTGVSADALTPLPAKDVVLDFGNGIRGTIAKGNWGIAVLDEHNDWIAEIDHDAFEEPMRSIVEKLLARQEKEKTA